MENVRRQHQLPSTLISSEFFCQTVYNLISNTSTCPYYQYPILCYFPGKNLYIPNHRARTFFFNFLFFLISALKEINNKNQNQRFWFGSRPNASRLLCQFYSNLQTIINSNILLRRVKYPSLVIVSQLWK